jgi:hypothetical protein
LFACRARSGKSLDVASLAGTNVAAEFICMFLWLIGLSRKSAMNLMFLPNGLANEVGVSA